MSLAGQLVRLEQQQAGHLAYQQLAYQAVAQRDWPLVATIVERLTAPSSLNHTEPATATEPNADTVILKSYYAWYQHNTALLSESLTTLQQDNTLNSAQRFHWQNLKALEQQLLQQPYAAAQALMASLAEQAGPDFLFGFAKETWQILMQLNPFALNQLPQDNKLQQGWVSLIGFTKRYTGQSDEFRSAFSHWQNQYGQHPANLALRDVYQQLADIMPYQQQRLAILLPLSGRFASQGQAVRNGILLAADGQTNDILFVDSAADNELQQQQLAQFSPDFVIGPLLKTDIEQQLRSGGLPYPQLFLNQPDDIVAQSDKFFFSLSPEHEVQQTVQFMVKNDVHTPAIFAYASASTDRLIQTFQQQWQDTGRNPAIIKLFSNNSEIQKAVPELLEVDASKDRIKELEQLVKQELNSEVRNRKDIDAIYILADPTQTRLVKPFLDINSSNFDRDMLIIANSRSHSSQVDKTDIKDLERLIFTEQPWLLPATQFSKLQQRYQAIWQQADDSQMRLFAMGYDAFTLINQLRQLQALPGATLTGLSGKLLVDSSGVIQRQLTWAQYKGKTLRVLDVD